MDGGGLEAVHRGSRGANGSTARAAGESGKGGRVSWTIELIMPPTPATVHVFVLAEGERHASLHGRAGLAGRHGRSSTAWVTLSRRTIAEPQSSSIVERHVEGDNISAADASGQCESSSGRCGEG